MGVVLLHPICSTQYALWFCRVAQGLAQPMRLASKPLVIDLDLDSNIRIHKLSQILGSQRSPNLAQTLLSLEPLFAFDHTIDGTAVTSSYLKA